MLSACPSFAMSSHAIFFVIANKVQSLVLVLFIQKAAPRISNVCKKLNNKCQVGCLNACKGMTSFIKILSELKKGC